MIDWAVVTATFVGPIVAVGVTLWYQGWSAKKVDRLAIYSAMMRNRRTPTNAEFVGAFNLVPVHFLNDSAVIERYKRVLDVVNNPGWNQPELRRGLGEQSAVAITHLLSAMSKAVKLPVEQLDIFTGAYAPQLWADDDDAQREVRAALMKILRGEIALPVVAFNPDEKMHSEVIIPVPAGLGEKRSD